MKTQTIEQSRGTHNTPRQNLEFQLTWTQTNLHYLLGDSPRNEPLIAATREKIVEIETELKKPNPQRLCR